MHLTKRTDYGIRVLMYCAIHNDYPNRISQIAEACCISELFLFKILQPLVKAGIVETVRGRRGGVRLCRPADQITILDVVKATEESFFVAECFASHKIDCPLVGSCGLTSVLRKALNAFFDVLTQYSIECLVRNRSSIKKIFNAG
ncbi:iron-responsive transcriptional regulator RirA [Candidatus Liberibacter asiaticus]|uniref:Iron-responsive transcriptional regulator n=2 Tax=Liberibacter asiaticus TaxID=34021 RepID=C6XFE0_LIBAP|nr:iron-responsive transcriptional regulator RirA [Candidatus Liberibacter asiaticus]ACT57093.1 iron-responsive transcriptional regulator [Candidatus Liberibacter asiaticus str. psy62]AGH16942.1 iron-responsive transcriptional regulator [Candidatus Liberibacter asiaticus str. gxpsy]ALK07281.1 iron-responsive transcriptional regulator RirA [Candidatus Liberibacter asiaticus]ASK52770.1 iron-responsive transcriptional regulator [Candidatus Liberibacter asiaticus]AWL14089.1 Rrf2 family transcripti